VKSAVLLAGLDADATTRVYEPGPSRDHTERALQSLGVDLRAEPDPAGLGATWILTPRPEPWGPRTYDVPPDFSSAAFGLAAAVVTDSTGVEVYSGLNPRRTGFLDALAAMGVDLALDADPPSTDPGDLGLPDPSAEPTGRIRVRGAAGLSGAELSGSLSLRALDELPLALGVAAFADGVTELRDAEELRIKESDRLEAMAAVLTAFGVECQLRPDGARVVGGRPRGASVDAHGDHRIAMTAAVMGLGATGVTRIRGADVVDVSYPGFVEDLIRLGAHAEWAPADG